MKPLFGITMSVACLALVLWGGVAFPAAAPPPLESSEYLMKVVQAAPWPLPATLEEAEGGWIYPGEHMVAEWNPPEIGSYEYSHEMETGNLPSSCAGERCPAEEFTLIEAGGILYRLEVDVGGN